MTTLRFEANELHLQPGETYTLSATLYVGTNQHLYGHGARIEADGDFPVITFSTPAGARVHDASVRDVTLAHTNTLDPDEAVIQGSSDGVWVYGDNILVSDVVIEDCFVGVSMRDVVTPDEQRGEAIDAVADPGVLLGVPGRDGYSTNVKLCRVRTSHQNPTAFTDQYGLLCRFVDGVDVTDCEWTDAWLDGVKTNVNCHNLSFKGGRSEFNGQCYLSGGTGAGDAMDFFAGGENISVVGMRIANCGGNGIIMKTVGDFDQGGTYYNPTYGWQRGFHISNCSFDNLYGAAITVEGVLDSTSTLDGAQLADAGEDDRPRASAVRVVDCTVSNTNLYGIMINGRDVQIRGCTFRATDLEAIWFGDGARDVVIDSCTIWGCATDGDLPAIYVNAGAKRVRIVNTLMNGCAHSDTTRIVSDASYDVTALTSVTNATDLLTLAAHPWQTGDGPMELTTQTTLPDGLELETEYWVIRLSSSTFRLAESYDDAVADTPVPVTFDDDGTGTHSMALYRYHTDGIWIAPGVDFVYVEGCNSRYHRNNPTYEAAAVCLTDVAWAAESVVIHHRGGTQTTANSRYTGGPGSTFTSTSAEAPGHTFWRKETGDPDVTTGWVADRQSTTTPTTVTGTTAIPLTDRLTYVNIASNAKALAAGLWEGQEKEVICTVDGGDGTITGTFLLNATAGTTVTLTAVGQGFRAQYHATGGWHIKARFPDTATMAIYPALT